MDRRVTWIRGGIALLAVVAVAYLLSPDGLVRQIWYDGLGLASVVFAWFGLRYRRPTHSRAWHLVLLGFLGWVCGDVVSSLEQSVWHLGFYPVPSDAIYLTSYAILGAGLLTMARSRQSKESLGVLLDAAIIAAGGGVLAGVFVLAPILGDSTLTLPGKLVSAAYPLADVLMLALLMRLWTSPGSRTSAFWLLNAALGLTLVGDIAWNFTVISSGLGVSAVWNDVLWLLAYVVIAAACWSPTIQLVSEPLPRREQPGISQSRVVWLAARPPAARTDVDPRRPQGRHSAVGRRRHRVRGALRAGDRAHGQPDRPHPGAGRPAGRTGPIGRPDRSPEPPYLGLRALPRLSAVA